MSTVDITLSWQMEVAGKDRPKMSFKTKYRLFEYCHMTFVLTNTPSTFRRALSLVLQDISAMRYWPT